MRQRTPAADLCHTGPRTGAVVVTYTLPAGYEYTGLAARHDADPEWQPAMRAKGELVFGYAAIGQQQVTNTLRISVKPRALAAPGVCLNTATVSAKLGYADTCGAWNGNAVQDSGKLTALRPDLGRLRADAAIADGRSGGGIHLDADRAQLRQRAGAQFRHDADTARRPGVCHRHGREHGRGSGHPASFATVDGVTAITWEVASLAAGQVLTAQVAARPLAARTAYSITAAVHAACDDGGCQQGSLSTSFNAPLQSFASRSARPKSASANRLSTPSRPISMAACPIRSVQIVDTLPRLGGRLVFSYTDVAMTQSAAAAWTADTATPGVITFTTGTAP